MISVQVGGSPDRDRHRLFVEGGGGDIVDSEFLKIFLHSMIDIYAMGPSFHLRNVATALYPYHPNYYFLIDRDHHDDQTVNDSWEKFPDPGTSNLLIWRKKEIENYFLDVDYLQRSQWINKKYTGNTGKTKLAGMILKLATDRLFMETANRVLLTIREEQKRTWIETFSEPSRFTNPEISKHILFGRHEFQERAEDVAHSVCRDHIERMFDATLEEMSGGSQPLAWNRGSWLDRMSGKEILRQVINNCFQARDRDENIIPQGNDQYIEVIKDLARQERQAQPQDFQDLYRLIDNRTRNP